MKVELLAPAGSYEALEAAFEAGADAVYLGGQKFGARAYADNLDQEQLIRAIDLAHLKGKQLYLTINTLLKNRELETELYEYLAPLYEAGLDAVIVQDPGVMDFVKTYFPGLHIHASTQMTITGVESAKLLQKAGATRVVTARELSLEEIKKIYDATHMEIESFVHGALCYCYSGQCLMSSMIGGRSGNRGRCAQPCRLPYQVYRDGKRLNNDRTGYALSPKDMCTVDILPEIIEAGVYSLIPTGLISAPPSIAPIAGKLSFSGISIFDFIVVIFAFLFVDLFDTLGTLIGVSTKAGFLDKEGKLPRIKGALFADALATTVGAVLGTSTVTTFVESASGVSDGGRSGLTALTAGVLFLVALLFSPILTTIPSFATTPALVVVGLMMVENVRDIDFSDYTEGFPAFMTILMMVVCYSISEGLVFGVISYVLLKLFGGKKNELNPVIVIIAILFFLKLILG